MASFVWYLCLLERGNQERLQEAEGQAERSETMLFGTPVDGENPQVTHPSGAGSQGELYAHTLTVGTWHVVGWGTHRVYSCMA